MFDSLLGAELPLFAKFILAFVIVLALIAGTFWLIRRLGANRVGAGQARGRQPRLAVIDAAAVDTRRKLVLIRRDNVEHLVMIGGPSDVVIEQNIVRAVPVAPAREPPPARGPGETIARGTDMVRPESVPPPPRPGAAAEPAWPPPPLPEGIRPRSEQAPRPSEPVRPLPESISPPRAAPPPEPRSPEPRPVPRQSAELPTVEVRQSPPTADVNLADMAQRLEAALRRPGQATEARTEPPPPRPVQPREPFIRPPPPRPAPAPEPPAPPVARPSAPRPMAQTEPAPPPMVRPAPPPGFESPPRPTPPAPPVQATPAQAAPPQAAPEPPPAPVDAPPRSEVHEPPKPEPAAPKPPSSKSVFDSLEEEMASLLGRPPDKP